MTARSRLLLLGAVVLFGVTLTLVAVESPWRAVPVWAFWSVVVVGAVARVVRHRSARRGLRPAAQGLDEVQDLYLGRIRPPVTYGTAEPVATVVEPVPEDPLAGGSVTLDPGPEARRHDDGR